VKTELLRDYSRALPDRELRFFFQCSDAQERETWFKETHQRLSIPHVDSGKRSEWFIAPLDQIIHSLETKTPMDCLNAILDKDEPPPKRPKIVSLEPERPMFAHQMKVEKVGIGLGPCTRNGCKGLRVLKRDGTGYSVFCERHLKLDRENAKRRYNMKKSAAVALPKISNVESPGSALKF
jgi:hypothetical protein